MMVHLAACPVISRRYYYYQLGLRELKWRYIGSVASCQGEGYRKLFRVCSCILHVLAAGIKRRNQDYYAFQTHTRISGN